MVSRPTILRARIAMDLIRRHPQGRCVSAYTQLLFSGQIKGDECREILGDMIADGLVATAWEPRPKRDPLLIYVAAPSLLAARGGVAP